MRKNLARLRQAYGVARLRQASAWLNTYRPYALPAIGRDMANGLITITSGLALRNETKSQ